MQAVPQIPSRLPHVESVIVPRQKIESYLLNLGHEVGGGKARFFIHFGFQRELWEALAEALCHHARANPVVEISEDAAGVKYIVEGPIETPSGRRPQVRAVWLVETGGLAPRFISAYPLDT